MNPHDKPKKYLPGIGQTLPVTKHDEGTGETTLYSFKITSYDTGEGARGILARAGLEKDGAQVIVKFPNLDEKMSPQDIEQRIEEFNGDVHRELDAYDKLQASGAKNNIAIVYGNGAYPGLIDDIRFPIPYVVQEYIDGLQLDKWCEIKYGSPFQGIEEADDWFKLSRKIVEILGWIHQERVVHGDIWQPNIMMRFSDSQPVFVDFGQAWRLDVLVGAVNKDSTPYAYYAPERLKTSEGPWYQPADLYSICGILFYLGTGCHPPLTYNPGLGGESIGPISKSKTKNEIVETFKKKNRKLYKANLGIPDIILYGLRPKAHERASYAEEVLEVMDYYRDAFRRGAAKPRTLSQSNESQDLCERFQEFCSEFGDDQIHERILKRILNHVRVQVNSLYSNLTSPGQQRSQLYNLRGGDRDELVKYLLAAFSGLRAGDQILAQTTPIFWRSQNFGANGRLLTMLKMAAIHGITIRWILLIENDKQWRERGETGLSRILESQRAAVEEATEFAETSIDIESKSIDEPGFYFGYRLITEEERKMIVRTAKTFIVVNEKDGAGRDNWTAILPTYTERNGLIANVRLWKNPKRWQHDWRKSFVENLQASTNIRKFYPRSGPEATI